MKTIGLIRAIFVTKKNGKLLRHEYTSLQKRRLKKLVRYAQKESSYYNRLYQHLNLNNFSITDLPPTNKIELMANFDEWVTDKSITSAVIQQFMLDKDNVGSMLYGKYLIYSTSGSTGNPSIVTADKSTFNVSAAISLLRSFARKRDFKAFMKRGKKTAGLFAVNVFFWPVVQ